MTTPTFTRQPGCSCALNSDGTVTTLLCSLHAEWDPCLTVANVTGRRRKGSIRKGVCSNCGHGRKALFDRQLMQCGDCGELSSVEVPDGATEVEWSCEGCGQLCREALTTERTTEEN